MTPDRHQRMPPAVRADYSLERYDARLQGFILSRFGLYNSDQKQMIRIRHEEAINLTDEQHILICICEECRLDMQGTTEEENEAAPW
jgi:hypothetical protein